MRLCQYASAMMPTENWRRRRAAYLFAMGPTKTRMREGSHTRVSTPTEDRTRVVGKQCPSISTHTNRGEVEGGEL